MKQCPKCGAEHPSNVKFCGECGSALPAAAAPAGDGINIGAEAMVAGDVIGKKETITGQTVNIHHHHAEAPSPPKAAPRDECVLKIVADLACRVYVDGEHLLDAEEDKVVRLSLERGIYLLKFVSLEYPDDIHQCEHTLDKSQELLRVPLKSVRDARLQKAREEQERREREEREKREREKREREEREKEFAEKMKLWRRHAEQGNADAQYNIGVCYYKGEGVTQDYAEAVKWFRKAAEQGQNKAQYLLGRLYDLGQGVTQDDAEAVKWYRKAAEQGHAKAAELLNIQPKKEGKSGLTMEELLRNFGDIFGHHFEKKSDTE